VSTTDPSEPNAPRPEAVGWRAGGLVFATSGAVLTLEIIAGRLMAPYVGVSIETFTGIIGTVLAGIAVGAAIGGWLADRHDPRLLIGPLLVIGGGLCWLSLPIVRVLGPEVGKGPVAIVMLTACSFLAPVTVVSAVSPMVAKLRLERLEDTGTVVGGLSAAGTAGALAATFLTGFVLVAALPSRPVVWLVGASLIVMGVVLAWRLGRRRPTTIEVAVVALVGVGSALVAPVCDFETAYFCVRIEADPQRPSGRSLYLDDLRHAYVDLDDPTVLESRYVRLFADVVADAADGPLTALHIGGGGFTFPRYVTAVRPASEHVVLEIDDELPRIARAELGLTDSDGLDIRIGDARLAIDDLPGDRFDLVVGDAFASPAVPWHLTTSEFVADIDRVLRPDGLYVMNVIDGGDDRFARAEIATLMEHFTHVAVIRPPDQARSAAIGAANIVLVASDRALTEADIDPADGTWIDGTEVERYVGDAQVLTDDFAPVDQLIAR